MKVEEFRELIHEDIEIATEINNSNEKDEFLSYVTGVLINGEEFDDFIECHCEGLTRRKGNYSIDGYALDETDGSCCIFITDYHGKNGEETINATDVNASFKKIRMFVEESLDSELFRDIANLAAKEFSSELFFENEKITKFRFYYLTDAYNRQRAKTIKDHTIREKLVELNVWDIERIYDLVSSQTQKESVEINFNDFNCEGLPCVKAVEYENIIADIDIVQSKDDNDKIPENVLTYSSYLAVVPGTILNELYLEYGSKLLEGNVRSFLSARGKVNKGIQSTIKNYPEMFFAYNNGIAATATEVVTEMTKDGLKIKYIKDLQIVNGGQTTASLTNTVLTAKKDENIQLKKVFVPMKLSVLEHTMSEKIIPRISECSNSQNKVEASDFFSNHPFHIRMEDFSRKTPMPSISGNQFQQYWFYERARGQYNQGKMKLKGADAKKYSDKYPEANVIKMVDLAKYMEIFECHPDIVSKGRQKMLQAFASDIKSQWEKSNLQYNAYYYKRMVAIAIIYKRTDEIIKSTEWYKNNHSYKANVIAYTMSVIFNHIKQYYKNYELDFNRIWDAQDIYEELEEEIIVLCGEVYNFITGSRMIENVTEWCKSSSCWEQAKQTTFTINDDFISTLVEKETHEDEMKEEVEKQKLVNEVNALKEIFDRGNKYWVAMLEWGTSRKMLSEKEISIIKLAINMFITGRTISDKQAWVVLTARQKLIENGMPMQF